MTKIEQIKAAVEKALRRESNLTPLALSVPALSSLNIRHLMNNLGAISSRYLEIGVHKGGLFCSTICGNSNIQNCFAIDNWASDELKEDKAEPEFYDNVSVIIPKETRLFSIKGNTFDIYPEQLLLGGPFDLYLYDAAHDEESQYKALIHFLDIMKEEFIFCVDDYDWSAVKEGTERAIMDSGVEVLYSNIWMGNDHDNEGAWNGFALFLLKKKK